MNTIKYVLTHEISHVLCPVFGHGPLFWRINKRMLKYAIYFGFYNYDDYRTNPKKYGEVDIRFNIIGD